MGLDVTKKKAKGFPETAGDIEAELI